MSYVHSGSVLFQKQRVLCAEHAQTKSAPKPLQNTLHGKRALSSPGKEKPSCAGVTKVEKPVCASGYAIDEPDFCISFDATEKAWTVTWKWSDDAELHALRNKVT